MLRRASKVGPWQLAALLAVFRVFDLLTYSPGLGGAENGGTVLAAIPPALVLLALVMLPAGLLMARFGGSDVIACAMRLSKPAGRVLAVLLGVVLLLLAGDTISNFEFLLTTSIYPQTPPWFFIATMTIVCTYAAYLGLEPVVRFNTVLFFLLVGTLIFLAVAVAPEASTVYLRDPFYDGAAPFWRRVAQLCFGNFDVLAWLMLAPHLRGAPAKSFGIWLLITAVISEAFVLLLTVGLGDYAATQAFPFLALASVAEWSVLQRLDSLHITLWTFLAFAKVAALLFLAAQSLGYVLPRKLKRTNFIVCGVLSAVAAGVISSHTGWLVAVRGALQSGVPVAVLAVLVPFALLVWAVATKKRGVGA